MRIVGSIHDSEPRKQLEELLRQGALYDEVTGLPNRKLFLERLDFAITDARAPTQLRYAVVFLDLDGFKLVNDSLGHLAGDRLLTQIGQRLRNGLRPADVAARFGGDEFAVLLHNIQPNAIYPIVARMQASLATSIDVDGHAVAVTASVGITTSDVGYTNAEDVLRDADIAMYHAKAQQPRVIRNVRGIDEVRCSCSFEHAVRASPGPRSAAVRGPLPTDRQSRGHRHRSIRGARALAAP